MAKNRNNLVELARFLFSLLVVGYHVQMAWAGDKLSIFEGGALAVYLFHPVIISAIEYSEWQVPLWALYLIVFSTSLFAAVAYNLIVRAIKKR